MIKDAAPAPADSGFPIGYSVAVKRTAVVPTTGTPVLVLHGPFPMRAALGIVVDTLVVRPLAPLVPAVRLQRYEIVGIEIENGHWYAFGRAVICIRRVKGPSLRLMAVPLFGVPDGTDDLGRLLRAWWRARA